MAAILIDLAIYHHGSLSGPRMEYVGGEVMTVEKLNADLICFSDIANLLEIYLGYKYNYLPTLYYKFDDESNEYVHILSEDEDIVKRLKQVGNGRRNKLHIFVDHVEPALIEVLEPLLMLSQSPTQKDVEQETPQEATQQAAQEPPQEATKVHDVHKNMNTQKVNKQKVNKEKVKRQKPKGD